MEHLAELPPFELWFGNIVVEDMATCVEVVEDIISLNSPPSRLPLHIVLCMHLEATYEWQVLNTTCHAQIQE